MCKEEPKFQDIASYQLQECEQIMRSLIAIQPKLLKEQKIEVANAYADLQTLSQTVLDTKSEMIWNEYLEKEWKTFVQDLDSIRQWTSGPARGTNSQGIEEQRIALIQKQMGKLQLILPKLSEKYVGDVNAEYSSDTQNASACLQKMQKMLKEATEKQRDKYNSWALENIQECNNICYESQGWFKNGIGGARKIANALIEKLGPIDQMLLTPAVHRCYQEVLNKYLGEKQLYKISDEDSWYDDSTVGYALLQMDAAEKFQLSQF